LETRIQDKTEIKLVIYEVVYIVGVQHRQIYIPYKYKIKC